MGMGKGMGKEMGKGMGLVVGGVVVECGVRWCSSGGGQ